MLKYDKYVSRRNGRCLVMSEYYSDGTDVAGGLPGYYPDEIDVAWECPNIIRTERTLLGDRSGCYPDEMDVAGG